MWICQLNLGLHNPPMQIKTNPQYMILMNKLPNFNSYKGSCDLDYKESQ